MSYGRIVGVLCSTNALNSCLDGYTVTGLAANLEFYLQNTPAERGPHPYEGLYRQQAVVPDSANVRPLC